MPADTPTHQLESDIRKEVGRQGRVGVRGATAARGRGVALTFLLFFSGWAWWDLMLASRSGGGGLDGGVEIDENYRPIGISGWRQAKLGKPSRGAT